MKLTAAELQTLRQMRNYEYYPFRQATCRKLQAKGLCEVVQERSGKVKVRSGYRITDAGRKALSESP